MAFSIGPGGLCIYIYTLILESTAAADAAVTLAKNSSKSFPQFSLAGTNAFGVGVFTLTADLALSALIYGIQTSKLATCCDWRPEWSDIKTFG